NRLILTG
nr:Chain B, synthetic peptide NRLILTG [synthetic construct]